MHKPLIRLVAFSAAVCSIALGGAAETFADTASLSSGTLTMTSDTGDWVGQGQQFSFATPQNTMSVGGGVHGFGADVPDANGLPNWSLRFGVPLGQTLAPGVYYDAQLFEDETHPRIDVAGEHRGCGAGTFGSFTVLAAEFGPYGYLLHVHATFEQHCDGAAPALRGELNAYAPTPPPPVEVHVTLDEEAGLDRGDGRVTLHGTVRCSTLIVAHVNASISQQTKKGPASAESGVLYIPECSPTPQRWDATLVSSTAFRFGPGTLQATADGQVMDDWYSAWFQNQPVIYATDHAQKTVALKPGT
jgi:hypothetical protein